MGADICSKKTMKSTFQIVQYLGSYWVRNVHRHSLLCINMQAQSPISNRSTPLHRQVIKIILPQISKASVGQTHEHASPGIQYRKLLVTATVQPIIRHLGSAEELPCTTIKKNSCHAFHCFWYCILHINEILSAHCHICTNIHNVQEHQKCLPRPDVLCFAWCAQNFYYSLNSSYNSSSF